MSRLAETIALIRAEPSLDRLKAEYAAARKAHSGQRIAADRLKAARHIALAKEVARDCATLRETLKFGGQ